MALTVALSHLFVVFLLVLISSAWGARLLLLFGCESQNHLEYLLFATGLAVGVVEIVVFGLALIGHLSFFFAGGLFAVMAATAGYGWKKVFAEFSAMAANLLRSVPQRTAALCVMVILLVDALLAMAPLTGSDAMNYHFTAPLLWSGRRMFPIFSSVPSFFTGQGHLLILLGLALGSDHVSLGLIYAGGVLGTAAVFAMSRLMMSAPWAWICTVIFIATPLIFWQMTTSGSPDIWMVFFVTLSLLAAIQCSNYSQSDSRSEDRWLILAGFYAGEAAGIKYTAWAVPIALVLYILLARRSFRTALLTGFASLAAGIWPLARNWMWTGDPVFPFLTKFLMPDQVNHYALTWITAETGVSKAAHDLPHLLSFPFAMILSGESRGFGHYFGPLVLLFSPLLFFLPWRNPLVRIGMTFWLAIYLSNLFSSQMGRFLLPVYGIGLALTFAAVAEIASRGFRISKIACLTSILIFLGFSIASDALYARSFLPVVLGLESEPIFLERMAPDYHIVEFINRTLGPDESGTGRVMVFFRHPYYVRAPFVQGSPEYSWQMDPAIYKDPDRLLLRLSEIGAQYVVRAPDYPEVLRASFSELEASGKLTPIASDEVEILTGTGRMFGRREKCKIVMLRVYGQSK